MPSFFTTSSLVVIIAILAYFYVKQNAKVDRGLCPTHLKPPHNADLRNSLDLNLSLDLPLECYFSDGYYDARTQFRQLAKETNAELLTMNVIEDLSTDVAIFRGNSEKVLLHISGTHGVEAYTGSASQAAILDYIKKEGLYSDKEKAASLPTVILIHALNPYGFAHNRRVNEDNIDINRNILNEEEFNFVKSRDPNYAGYVDLDSLLNPTSKFHVNLIINEVMSLLVLGKAMAIHGLPALKKALVSGNYHKQKGVGFGGFEQSKSVKNLLNLLIDELNIPSTAKEFILVDVHSGLGPEGVDTLMFHGSREWSNQIESLFPTDFDANKKVTGALKVEEFSSSPLPEKSEEKMSDQKQVNDDAKAVAAGYELTVGTVSGSLCTNYLAAKNENMKYMCVTQNIMQENSAFQWENEEYRKIFGEKLKHVFFIDSKDWKRKIVVRGFKLFLQAFNELAK